MEAECHFPCVLKRQWVSVSACWLYQPEETHLNDSLPGYDTVQREEEAGL